MPLVHDQSFSPTCSRPSICPVISVCFGLSACFSFSSCRDLSICLGFPTRRVLPARSSFIVGRLSRFSSCMRARRFILNVFCLFCPSDRDLHVNEGFDCFKSIYIALADKGYGFTFLACPGLCARSGGRMPPGPLGDHSLRQDQGH